jgi:hypothetical protein
MLSSIRALLPAITWNSSFASGTGKLIFCDGTNACEDFSELPLSFDLPLTFPKKFCHC